MTKLFLATLIFLYTLNGDVEEIYTGSSFGWQIYYDSKKSPSVVEVGGIKYGYLDYLKCEDKHLDKTHKRSKLYTKKGNLFYKNDELGINIRLKKKSYSTEIDYQRCKIFEINAFNEIRRLQDSLNTKFDFNSEFDSLVKLDYQFYKESSSMPKNHIPKYKELFFRSLN